MSSTSKIGNQGVLDAYGGLCISIKVKGQIPRQFMSIAMHEPSVTLKTATYMDIIVQQKYLT